MESIAVEWGVPANEYWAMSYAEIVTQVEANKKRYEMEMRNRAMFDYNAAQLNAYAFNQPNKMPKIEAIYPFLKADADQVADNLPVSEQPYNASEDQAILMQALMGINNHIKKNGGEKIDGNGIGET